MKNLKYSLVILCLALSNQAFAEEECNDPTDGPHCGQSAAATRALNNVGGSDQQSNIQIGAAPAGAGAARVTPPAAPRNEAAATDFDTDYDGAIPLAKYNRCYESQTKASDTCDPQKSGDLKTAMTFADQIRGAANTMSQSSPQAACGLMGKLALSLNLATGAYKGYCSKDFLACQDDCRDETDQVSQDLREARQKLTLAERSANVELVAQWGSRVAQLEDSKRYVSFQTRKCVKLGANIDSAKENITSMMAVRSAMANCQKVTGLNCAATPNNPICSLLGYGDTTNCATSAGAATIVCICKTNPSDPRCGSSMDSSSYGMTGGAGASGSGGDLGVGGFGGLGGGADYGPEGIPPGEAGAQAEGGSLAKGASAGKGASESGGGGPGGGAGGAGAAGAGANTKIIGGYGYGGGSGGGNGYRSPGSAGGGSAGSFAGRTGASVDLKQFLPGGGMDPSRNMAGETGPDGITGPNSDIWAKVKTRYYSKKPSLLP